MLNKKKGFLMAELLVVIMIISFISLLYLPHYPKIELDDELFINEFHLAQAEAMAQRSDVQLNSEINTSFPITFNEAGNVNMAQTIVGKKGSIIIHLGNGYVTYEK